MILFCVTVWYYSLLSFKTQPFEDESNEEIAQLILVYIPEVPASQRVEDHEVFDQIACKLNVSIRCKFRNNIREKLSPKMNDISVVHFQNHTQVLFIQILAFRVYELDQLLVFHHKIKGRFQGIFKPLMRVFDIMYHGIADITIPTCLHMFVD